MIMFSKMSIASLASVSSLLALACALPAYAQTAPSAPAAVAPSDIVVTAQRRSEKAQDVPITLTNLSADTLKTASVQTLGDIAHVTPALRFDNQGGFSQPTIRGVGTGIAASGSGSNVGVYVDGFYAPSPLSTDFSLLNVNSVQVLKGPQGTLFGRNTTGGAILVTTSQPSETPSIVAEASYGRFNAQKYQAYATAGLGGNLSFDIAGLYRQGDGYIHNIATGSNKDGAYNAYAVRGGLMWKASSDISFLLRYTHSYTVDPSSAATGSFTQPGSTYGLSVGSALPPAYGALVATQPYQVSNNDPTYFNAQTDAVQLTSEFDLGGAKLVSYSQYRHETSLSLLDLDGSSVSVFDAEFKVEDKVFTQEFLLTSKNKNTPLNWTAGLYFFNDKNDFRYLDASVQGGPITNLNMTGTNTYSYAAFADATYRVADKFFITGGLRYSINEIRNPYYAISAYAVALGAAPGPAGTYYPGNSSNDKLSPRIVLKYKPDNASSIYASYTQGYKAPIFNVNGYATSPTLPENIDAYEVGYKHSDRTLTFDLSGFYYNYKNLQVANYIGTQAIVSNAANSEIYGAEMQLSYKITPAFELYGGLAYTHAEYKNFASSPAYNQCLSLSCGLTYGLFLNTAINASGFQMQRSPEFTGNLGLRYHTDFGGGNLQLSSNLYYTSSFYFDTSEQFKQDGYALLGLRAEWTDPSKHYTLAVFGDNVTNTTYRNQVLPGTYAIQDTWGAPATYGASIRIKL